MKILVIAGSTYNIGSIEIISQQLNQTNFLEQWAAIIINHEFYKIYELNESKDNAQDSKIEYKNSIKQQFSELQEEIIFCEGNSSHPIRTGKIFIVPDTETIIPKRVSTPQGFLSDIFFEKVKNQLCIYVSTNTKGKYNTKEIKKWLRNNPYDLAEVKREVNVKDIRNYRKEYPRLPLLGLPENSIDDVGNKYDHLNEMIQTFDKIDDNCCIYRDLPCIDKTIENLSNKQNITLAGLLLCGCFGDGALGFKTLKEKGFHTAIQTPGECQCDSPNRDNSQMPTTALQVCPEHTEVTLFDMPNIKTLEDWLLEIKDI